MMALAWHGRGVAAVGGEHPPDLEPGRPAKPARVRSRMRARSNSARAPKTWNTRRPPGVLVSM